MNQKEKLVTTKRRFLGVSFIIMSGCTSKADDAPMTDTNDSTNSSDYNGVTAPEPNQMEESPDDVMDDDVYAIATAADPEAVADKQGSPTADEGLLAVAHLTVDSPSEADAPAEFARVAVVVENRVEGTVPFDQLTELAADETVERLATAQVTTQEAVSR